MLALLALRNNREKTLQQPHSTLHLVRARLIACAEFQCMAFMACWIAAV